jgi:hypothetical protein
MRIGTWNLDGRWGDDHQHLLLGADCDVWLLTEVGSDVRLHGYEHHFTESFMSDARHWAGILSREPIQPLPDPHPASVAVTIGDRTYCSSELPWRSCGWGAPWEGANHAERMASALRDLREALRRQQRLAWGGDWNQSLLGANGAGSVAGRKHLLAALEALELQSPLAGLTHQMFGHATIDHVAVGLRIPVSRVERIPARRGDSCLSDHDAYVIQTDDSLSGRVPRPVGVGHR